MAIKRVRIDDECVVSIDDSCSPSVIRMDVLDPTHDVSICVPYVRDSRGIRPALKGETPTAQLRIEIVREERFRITVLNSVDNQLNTIDHRSCSLLIDPSASGTEVQAVDGIYDWTQSHMLSRKPEQ